MPELSRTARTIAERTTDGAGPAPEFTVIVPCYNEEGAIRETLASLTETLAEAPPHEVIVVDDASTDDTSGILEAELATHPGLQVVRHASNRGYGGSLKTGIRRARGELIVITDADGTYPNHRIPELVELAREADMVVGSRTGDDVTYSWIRKLPKAFLRRYCCWLADTDIPDMNSGLRVFRRDVAEKFFNILPNTFSFTTTITLALLTNHHDVRFVPIDYHARVGRSKIQPIRDTLRFIQLIVRTGMYFAPLRVLAPPALILLAASLGSAAYDAFVLRNLTDKTVLFLVSGGQLLALALLADMIDKRQPR